MRLSHLALLPALLVGCLSFDSDDDGLSNAEEEELGTNPDKADSDGDGLKDGDEVSEGTDPNVADTDGDGLTDGDEVDLGADPLSEDSDGDGYRDGDEVTEGSDPTDASSLIYAGGWPYTSDKDGLGAPDFDSADYDEGELIPRFALIDQFGDTVDIYDFANQGKPVVIDISAVWCGPCNGIAEWLSGEGDSYGFGGYWPDVPDVVAEQVYWVTILGESRTGGEADLEVVEDWYEDYPDDHIPVLADSTHEVSDFFVKLGWPTILMLNEDLTMELIPNGNDPYMALDALQAMAD